MRIIAGQWRGRKLVAPAGDTTRPTADRTRETLFSMLLSRLGTFDGLTVGDFFAGSGALGLEALSRGAANCVFVEQDAAALRALRANIAALRGHGECDVHATSVMALGPARNPLDLLLLDPPYGTNAGLVALEKISRLGWIGPTSWIALETGQGDKDLPKKFALEATRVVGRSRIALIRPQDT